jgi:predicted AlkP superfamily pyrophosphatase or phosphodiesterase
MVPRFIALILAGGLLTAGTLSRPLAQTSSDKPSLLVLLVVDQMRFDYLTKYKEFWKGGFKRLLDEGAVFEEARYPYLNTVTCAGHSTIGTGAFPSTHGIALNEWWDRDTNKRTPCTLDASVQPMPYAEGTPEPVGHSAHNLRIPTFGDRLRDRFPQSRVVSLSMKPRSAVMMAGHGGTVTWISDTNSWATSTAFTKTLVPEIASYVQAHPVDDDRKIEWQRVYDASRYAGEDASDAERPRKGWANTFPHPLSGAPGTPAKDFYDLWERSPYSDAYLGRMAAALLERFELGKRGATDMLAVSFSGLDYVGHDFGPDSQEAEDTVIRLDQTIGDLFAVLDRRLGRDRYVVALSADHGAAPIPELRVKQGLDAGRVLPEPVKAAAEKALASLGPGPHVADVQYTDLYLTDSTRAQIAGHPEKLQPLIDGLSALPGVLRVLPASSVDHQRSSSDPIVRAAAFSYAPGRSGDVLIVPKPYWIMTNSSATTHGTFHPYDQHVPVILLGKPFKAGYYRDAASPADIMPTFASLIGLPMPGVDGKALEVARSNHTQ